MTETGRWFALVLSAAMFAFSVWIFMRTGDWVALIFAAGSCAYALFFVSARVRNKS